jgi:hypothetical protein
MAKVKQGTEQAMVQVTVDMRKRMKHRRLQRRLMQGNMGMRRTSRIQILMMKVACIRLVVTLHKLLPMLMQLLVWLQVRLLVLLPSNYPDLR